MQSPTKASSLFPQLCAVAGFSALMLGCYEPVELVAEPVVVDTLVLQDAVGIPVSTFLEVEQLVASAGTDLLVDWSELRHDLWGAPIEATLDAQRVMLYHFRIDDQAMLLEGIEQGTLSQSVVDLQVSCQSETARCTLSEFTFMVGHEIDVVERFVEGAGAWLLVVQSNDGTEELAYLSVRPSADVNVAEVAINDDSSVRRLEAELADSPAVLVTADVPLVVDWSALTTDSLGEALQPNELDTLMLARVPEAALGDPDAILTDLWVVADEVWVGDAPTTPSLPLAELVNLDSGARGFAGFAGSGTWLLTLGCEACGDTMPRFVTRLQAVAAP
jgi:hypothetical protein